MVGQSVALASPSLNPGATQNLFCRGRTTCHLWGMRCRYSIDGILLYLTSESDVRLYRRNRGRMGGSARGRMSKQQANGLQGTEVINQDETKTGNQDETEVTGCCSAAERVTYTRISDTSDLETSSTDCPQKTKKFYPPKKPVD